MSKWRVDLGKSTNAELRFRRENNIPPPPGFAEKNSESGELIEGGADGSAIVSAESQLAAKQRQVMAIAYSPGKNLFTTGLMLWFSGSSIQIFSIMMTGMALINPIKAIASTNQTFARFVNEEGVDLKLPKLIFLALQILSLGMALYKCSTMGLLPLTSADWTSYIPAKSVLEHSGLPL